MTWWILEVAQFLGLVGLAIGLQRLIRRTGKAYVDQLFGHAPAIGAAFVLLADIALYLIFAAYALFNVGLTRDEAKVSSGEVEEVIYSVAGIALVIGILHLVNIVFLPLLAGLMHGQRGVGSNAVRSTDAAQLEGRLGTLDVTVTLRQAG